jgi:interferon-induced GTP-binding protein Mx1
VISKVNAMIDEYLSMERTIILAVIPSNQDIATIDILERAQKVGWTHFRVV